MFIMAMTKIKRSLSNLDNCVTNEMITKLHFIVLSLQGFFATLYSVLYVIVYLIHGDIDPKTNDI